MIEVFPSKELTQFTLMVLDVRYYMAFLTRSFVRVAIFTDSKGVQVVNIIDSPFTRST
jgi:hypothetical protein